MRKLVSSPAIQFKGTGWYITDYARKPAPGQPAAEEKKDGGSDAKSAESPKTADSESSTKGSGSKPASSNSKKATSSST